MTDRNVEIEAARLLLQEQGAAGSPVADVAMRAAMEQMMQTAAALRAWRQGHESLAAPVIVPLARRSLRLWIGVGVAAAAAAVVIAFVMAGFFAKGPERDSAQLAAEMSWTAQAAQTPLPDQSVQMEFQATKGGPGGPAGAGGGDTLRAGPENAPPPELTPFIRQFAFAFRIPQQLPGGWEFIRGRPISETQVQLIYRNKERLFFVFVTPTSGPDAQFRDVEAGGEKIVAGRRGGLAIAFAGGHADGKTWNKVVGQFITEKGREQ